MKTVKFVSPRGFRPPGFVFNFLTVGLALIGWCASATQLAAQETIISPAPTPEVSVVAIDPGASEAGPSSGAFSIRRTGPTSNAVTVFYNISGSAIAVEDFEPLGWSVTIPAGAMSATILVRPIADRLHEGFETVRLTLLGSPVAAPMEPYRIGSPDFAEVTISDDDLLPPENRAPEVRLLNPLADARFAPGAPILLEAGAHDADGWVARVEFFAGTNRLGSATNDPGVLYFANPFRLTWADAPEGEYDLTARAVDNLGLATVSRPVRIRVGADTNPPPPATLVRVTVVKEHATEPALPLLDAGAPLGANRPIFFDSARLRVERRGWTNGPLVVSYRLEGTASNGVDYARLPGVVTIPAGETEAFIDVVPLADNEVEPLESVTVILEPLACLAIFPPPPECYQLAEPARGTVFIHDAQAPTNPPPPVVTIVATVPEAAEEGSRPGRFTVSRTGDTNAELFVNLAIGGRALNGVDYAAIEPHVRIPAGAAAADIVIAPVDDAFAEGTESVEIAIVPPLLPLAPPSANSGLWWWSPPYVVGEPGRAVVRIIDNDGTPTNHPPQVRWLAPREGAVFPAGATIFLAADAVDSDGAIALVEFFAGTNRIGTGGAPPRGGTAAGSVNVRREAPPLGPYSFAWTDVLPGEYHLTARAVDDAGAVTVSPPILVRVLTNAPPPEPPTPTNQPVVFTITAIDAYASEGTNALGVRNPAVFKVRRTGATNTDVTVAYSISGTASNGVDYLELPGTVTIPAGRRSAEIVVVPIDDEEIEPVETVVLTLLPPVSGDHVIGGPSVNEMTVPGTPGGDRVSREHQRAVAFIADNDGGRPPTQQSPDGFFHVTHAGTNGFHFSVEVTTNFVNWMPVHTNTVLDGAVHFVDPAGSRNGLRFYRVVPQPAEPTDAD